jgi:cell pole-organizing protein PopZ
MEEILASIRRIIESNEPGAGTALSDPLPPVYAADEDDAEDDIRLTIEDEFDAANDDGAVEQRFVPARIPEPANQAEPTRVPERSLSLADVAARVRAASNRTLPHAPQPQAEVGRDWSDNLVMSARMVDLRQRPEAVAESPVAEAPQAEAAAAPEIALDSQIAPFEIEAPVSVDAVAVEAAAVTVEQQAAEPVASAVTATPMAAEPFAAEEPAFVAPPPVEAAAAPAAQPASQSLTQAIETEAKNLLSPLAGQQVANSFSELAAAFDGIQRQSLEDLAGEMLRPLLQEWLDDNLPTLVERLVREEIERVARGPRR